MSLTPFSGPALDRGLTGALVTLARLWSKEMTTPAMAMSVPSQVEHVANVIETFVRRASRQPTTGAERESDLALHIKKRARDLFDAWASIAHQAKEDGAERGYSRFDKEKNDKPLLRTPLDEDAPPLGSPESKFHARTSMRDVEPVVHLWLTRSLGGDKDGQPQS
jgi:hypothetical protein